MLLLEKWGVPIMNTTPPVGAPRRSRHNDYQQVDFYKKSNLTDQQKKKNEETAFDMFNGMDADKEKRERIRRARAKRFKEEADKRKEEEERKEFERNRLETLKKLKDE